MNKGWKLWPSDYIYKYHNIIWGIGFDLFIATFILKSVNANTEFVINEKPVTLTEFLIPVFFILMIGLLIAAIGIKKNIKVYQLRKELKILKDNFKCYDGTISGIERLQVNDVMKGQADNIHNKYTRVLNKVDVDYMDEDGRKRIASSEEYSEYLSAFLKNNKAKVYVSNNGNNRIVDELSWRQSNKDEFIDVPGAEMKEYMKRLYYRLFRLKDIIEIIVLIVVFIIIFMLIL
jgi:hypothetical protein